MVVRSTQSGRLFRSGMVLAGFVFAGLLLFASPLSARGQAEGDHHHDHDHEHHGGIVHAEDVEPVDLDGEQLSVVASTSILADIVGRVAGSAADVSLIIPAGQSPHGYQPVPRDMATIERAHLVFVNGFGLEEALLETIEANTGGFIVEASERIVGIEGAAHSHHHHDHDHDHDHGDDHDHDHDHGDDHEHDHDHDHDHGDDHDHDHGAIDPHVWFDPLSVVSWVEVISTALASADPDNAATYERNAEELTADLEALHDEMVAALASVPADNRKLIVDHSAMAYFAERYDFEEIGAIIPDTTDQVEPSPRDVAGLVEIIREEQVPAIFVGETAGDGVRGLADAITREVGRPVRVGQLLTGSLTSGGEGDDYISFMRYNVRQIAENLSD